jgi:hypothetical protein
MERCPIFRMWVGTLRKTSAVRYCIRMTDLVEPPPASPTIGRNPYDAAVEILRMLGRAAPWFVFVAGLLYAAQQIYAVNQSKEAAVNIARVEATKEQSQQIAALNDRLRDNDKSMEELRTNQMNGLKQILDLTQTITASITKSQTDLLAQRDELFAAREKSDQAQRQLAAALATTRDLESQRANLEKQAMKARDIMDSAARMLNYLENPGAALKSRTELSRRFENNDASRISVDATGNYFYGAFRLPGDEMSNFLAWLNQMNAELAKPFLDGGGGPAAQKGAEVFRDKWLAASIEPNFSDIQAAWIDEQRYEPFIQKLTKSYPSPDNQAFAKRSVALQAVLWSVVNQHGMNNRVIADAWKNLNPASESDLVLICKIYEVERSNTAVYFPRESEQTHALLRARYRFEREEALRMLKAGTNMKDDPQCER